MLTDRHARQIAADWHDNDALYALASTGAITNTTAATIRRCLHQATDQTQRHRLQKLLGYVQHHGPRGPQPGWSALSW